MENCVNVYEGVVKPTYIKYIGADVNRAGHIKQIRGESALSKVYSDMGKCTGKRK